MLKLSNCYVKLGATLKHVKQADLLADEGPTLAQHFREAFRKSSDHFRSTILLEGFAPVAVEFTALCPTAGMVVVTPYAPIGDKPDAISLLINGLESPEEVEAVRSRVPFPPQVWEEIDRTRRPVAVTAFWVNGRLRDPATITILSSLANTYFSFFGTTNVERFE